MAVAVATLVGGLGVPSLVVTGLAAMLGIVVAALAWGSLAGMVAATLGVAALVSGLSGQPGWGSATFWPTVALVFAMVCLAVAAGTAGHMLRARKPAPMTGPHAVDPRSVGLLNAEAGLLRLAEETERARVTGTALAVATVVLDAGTRYGSLPEGAERAVMRAMDARVLPTDIPFVAGPGEFRLVMPGRSSAEALTVVAELTAGLQEASFADRTSGKRVRLVESAEVRITVTGAGSADADSSELSGLGLGAR